MALHGYTSQLMVIYGDTWQKMAIHGRKWLYMASHGYTSLYMVNEMANFFAEKISNTRSKFHECTIQDCQDCAPIMEIHSQPFGSFKEQGSFSHEHAQPLNKRCAWRLTTGFAFLKMARLKAIITIILLVGLGECAHDLKKMGKFAKKL